MLDRSGLVVRCRLRGRSVTGSKPESTEDPFVYLACCTLNHTQGATRPPVCVVRKSGEGVPAQVSSSSSDLGSNLRGPSKIALVVLQNGMLT
ncbi:hypothetical protein AVEN_248830-1 [Araneus ventricosus]|uniref:Uncharacterized protein n=1 Tax=Araneus ventricosus TaxID=182803 RepID=A0A4Y2HXP9_ARAVE|nr:hypothetical protein AVEN_248830-1 [Araneus ventricosus]